MNFPRIKPVLLPVQLANHRICLGTMEYEVGVEIEDDEQDHVWQLINLMDGTRTTEEIVHALLQAAPELDQESVGEAIGDLTEQGFVEDAGASPPVELTATELDRYSRQANFFAWVDRRVHPSPYTVQQCLKQARVTVLGLGGTGSAVVTSLAAIGIGHVHCVDFDSVEQSNLGRQLVYNEDDLGCSKTERAVAHLQRLNGDIAVTGEELQVQSVDDVVRLMNGCDLFILCADTPPWEIDLWTNDAALRTRTPWLRNYYSGPTVAVSMLVPFETPCYQCSLHAEEQRGQTSGVDLYAIRTRPQVHAAIAPIPNIAGHLAALEAVYFLAGLQAKTVGREFHQSLWVYDHVYYTDFAFWNECPACGPSSPYRLSINMQAKSDD